MPLHLPLGPEYHNIENHNKKKKKSSNDYVINVNDEFVVDLDINADDSSIIREDAWIIEIGYRL